MDTKNGLTKAQAMDMIGCIDLIGLTLTMEQVTGEKTPANIQESLILLLAGVREQMAKSYGIDISARESIGQVPPSKHHLSPSEAADEILRDLNR